EVVGAFQVLNKFDENGDDGLFDNGDARRLTLVAAFCEKTLESYMLYNEAMVDELTKLPNRYAFYEYYNKKAVRFMEDRDMWVIMCDIDHFKMVNDTYGHNNGDFILKNVAAILNESVSEDNIVVRWGGEEFVFIVSGSNLEEVKQFADSIRKDIEKHEFNTGKEIINITMSFGVSRADKNVTIEENVHRADDRLYMAKDSGRNRVV
ncbi:MAG: GGDEF domain-containing protein, partial [Lachnospiraceae bacterium]|nr:GGDEF domain-containing protein [Lachnospiraceae bacterium]